MLSQLTLEFKFKGEMYTWVIAADIAESKSLEKMLDVYLTLCDTNNIEPEVSAFCNCVNKLDDCIALPTSFMEQLEAMNIAKKVDSSTAHLN
jgi:hypothetical protein